MHTLLMIVGGLLLGLVFALFGHLWGGNTASVGTALRAFIPAWLVLTAINMWIGVNRAGYSVMQELPIQAVVFLVPAAAAFACALVITR